MLDMRLCCLFRALTVYRSNLTRLRYVSSLSQRLERSLLLSRLLLRLRLLLSRLLDLDLDLDRLLERPLLRLSRELCLSSYL